MSSSKITQVSNLAILGVRDDGELHQSGSSGEGGEKWSDSGYILNVETTDFPNRVAMMCERKKGVQNDPKNFGPSHCKDGV